MATDVKVVRLSHQQLLNLAQDLETSPLNENEVASNDIDADIHAERQRKKKPEREIYRPGVNKLRRRGYSESEEEPRADSQSPTATGDGPRPLQEIMAMGRQLEEMAMAAASEDFIPSQGHSEKEQAGEQASGQSKGKRRSKRPDLQIYVPKARLQGSREEDLHGEEDQMEDPEATSPPQPPEVLSADSQDSQRLVNVVPDVREMLVTVINDESTTPAPSNNQRGRANRGKRPSSAGNRRRRGGFGRRSSVGSDGNLSEGSMEMEWDYNADIEVGEKRFAGLTSSDIEPSVANDEWEYGYDDIGPHNRQPNNVRRQPQQKNPRQNQKLPTPNQKPAPDHSRGGRRGRGGMEGRTRHDSQSSQDYRQHADHQGSQDYRQQQDPQGSQDRRRRNDSHNSQDYRQHPDSQGGQDSRRQPGRRSSKDRRQQGENQNRRRDGSACSDHQGSGREAGREGGQGRWKKGDTSDGQRGGRRGEGRGRRDGSASSSLPRVSATPPGKRGQGRHSMTPTPPTTLERQAKTNQGKKPAEPAHSRKPATPPYSQPIKVKEPVSVYQGNFQGLVITNSKFGPSDEEEKGRNCEEGVTQDATKQKNSDSGSHKANLTPEPEPSSPLDITQPSPETPSPETPSEEPSQAASVEADVKGDLSDSFGDLASLGLEEHKDWADMVQEAEEAEAQSFLQSTEEKSVKTPEKVEPAQKNSPKPEVKSDKGGRGTQNLQLKVTVGPNERRVQHGSVSQNSSVDRELGGKHQERRGGKQDRGQRKQPGQEGKGRGEGRRSQDRRAGQEDRRAGPEDRRSGQEDRRHGPEDRRVGQEERRHGPEDRRGGQVDRRHGPEDRRGGQEDRRHGQEDRRQSQDDRRQGQDDRRRGQEDRGQRRGEPRSQNRGSNQEERTRTRRPSQEDRGGRARRSSQENRGGRNRRPSLELEDRGGRNRRPSLEDRGGRNRRPSQDEGGRNSRPSQDDGGRNRRPSQEEGGRNRRPSQDDGVHGRDGRGREPRNVGGLIRLPTNAIKIPDSPSGPGHSPRGGHSGGGHPAGGHSPGGLYHGGPHQGTPPHGGPQHQPPHSMGRGRGRGRARGSHRVLYDPHNPTKHLNQPGSPQQALQFTDQPPPDNYQEYSESSYYNQSYFEPGQTDPYYYYQDYQAPSPAAANYTDDTYSRDPYYHSDIESDTASGRASSTNQTKAEHILRDVQPLDSQLSNIVSRRINGAEGLQKLSSLRRDVQMKYEQIVLLDPDLANTHNVEQGLWKSAFYQVIEMLRRQLLDGAEESDKIRAYLLTLLDEGTSFYESLLQNLQTSYHFKLDDFLDTNQLPPENLRRSVKLALLSVQRCMICMGDIARYKEQANQTTNYGRARSWYMKAQQIAPKNGRPYNQLAILALYTRRKLDAVYYYMRSLAASNPFLTARESLMSLFDEARKKAEASEKKKLQAKVDARREKQARKDQGHRVEIWISADGSTSQGPEGDQSEDDLTALSAVELNKRFVLSFLNVHGKLFTKIGMEFFPEILSQMLYEFEALLQHSPSPIGNIRLLQLMAINMYAIDNTAPKEDAVEEGCRSLHQEHAVQLGLDMFALLTARCVSLFKEHLESGDCAILSEDLHQLFPSVKVWSDWMTCHADLWNPPPLPRDPDMGPKIDVWKAVADLCNILKEVDIGHVKMYTQKKEGCDPIVLGEDTMLLGFVPLLSLPEIPMFVHCTVDKEIARDCLRVEKLRTFGDYLCGIEPPLLMYDVETHRYVSIAAETSTESESPTDPLSGLHDSEDSKDEDDIVVESQSDGGSDDEDHIRHLRAKKEELESRKAEQERKKKNIQAVLDTSQQGRAIELEITPVYLIPDTNCFIDHLDGIQALVNSKKYTVVVPLVVISELDGLAKGSQERQRGTAEHAAMVTKVSSASVAYLEAEFNTRNTHLRALTSKGTQMDTISFRSEEVSDTGNNDDLILSCCIHYCQDKARDFMPKTQDDAIRLHRDVVLLTDDRNLRLKAHLRNVPVKDIPAFLQWACVS